MENKEIVLDKDHREIFENLSNEQAGVLVKHIFSKIEGEDSDVDMLISLSFKALEKCLRVKKKKIIKAKKEYSVDVKNCYMKCLEFFPEHLRPEEGKEGSWLDTIEKLNRIDKIPFEVIEFVVEKTRGNDFWSKNFLSLTKLRKKDKQDIMYIVVFNERIGNGNKQKTANTVSQEYVNRVIRDLQS